MNDLLINNKNTMNYPNGVYIAFNLSKETEDNIKEYCSQHIPGIEMNEDLHSTLVFSKKAMEKKIDRKPDRAKGKFKQFSKFGKDEESLVIELDSEDMMNLHKWMTSDHDFISDFPDYKPHVSITYKGKDIDIENLPPMDFEFDMEHQVIENIDEWYGCDCMEKESESDDDNKEPTEDDEEWYHKWFAM